MSLCYYTSCSNEATPGIGICESCKQKIQDFSTKCDKAKELMSILDIKQNELTVHINTLYDIFMDDEKMKVLNSKLRNKIFW